MLKESQKMSIKQRKRKDNKIHLTTQIYINKKGGQLQHKIWKLGKRKKKTTQHQQYDKVIDQ